jgi:hypothetical protein
LSKKVETEIERCCGCPILALYFDEILGMDLVFSQSFGMRALRKRNFGEDCSARGFERKMADCSSTSDRLEEERVWSKLLT